jgi:type I restriction enzyme M protein
MSKVTANSGSPDVAAIPDGKLLDYITNKPVANTSKEQVRQRIARALFHEYGISADDMAPDVSLKIDGRNRKVDIAIFTPGGGRNPDDIRRIVICDKEPKLSEKSAYRMRDHKQAEKEFALLHAAMAEAKNCRYGLWTNGLDFFFFEKEETRFDIKFKPIGDWPMGDESLGTKDIVSNAHMRRATPEMLRIAFRRCHNYIHGNEGMPKDVAFWQVLFLIFAKMHDERQAGDTRRFWAGPTEQFDEAGRNAIRGRIKPLFSEVKQKYSSIFRGDEEITLSDRALAFMVSELAKYDFGRTDVDAKGAAYQEIVGANLRGDKGQYFTPRGAIKFMVQMLDPKPSERVLDPACGTGGFLVATLDYLNKRFHEEAQVAVGAESTDEFLSIQDRLSQFAQENLFGADFDQFLVRAAQMNVVMASNAEGHLYHMNSLEFPLGHLSGVELASKEAPLGSMDVVMTNPPFGSEIPITDPNILRQFDLAHVWERAAGGAFRNTGRLQGSVAPETLFIERVLQFLKPGGRAAVVLPNGILSNASDVYIREWILRNAQVLASIDLPMETFIPEAKVNILTSLLFLRKRTQQEILARDLGNAIDENVFFAVAERIGYDRRGLPLFVRSPEGRVLLHEEREVERIRINGEWIERTLRRMKPELDDDLPRIVSAWRHFLEHGVVPQKEA